MSVFVGIDPGLTCTSVAVLTSGGEHKVQDVWPEKLRGPERLDHLLQEMKGLVPRADLADLVALEGYAFGARNAREAMGEWGGLLRWWLWREGHRVVVVPPSTLKMFVAGKGNAQKDIMIREVFRKWAYEAEGPDDADSYALARFAEAFHRGGTKTFKNLAKRCETLGKAPL